MEGVVMAGGFERRVAGWDKAMARWGVVEDIE